MVWPHTWAIKLSWNLVMMSSTSIKYKMHLFQSNSIDIKSCMNILDVVKNIPPLLYNILLSSIVIFESKLSNGIPSALFSLPYTSLFIFKLSMMLCDVIVWRLWFRVDFLLDFVLKSLTIVFNPLLWFNTYSYTCFRGID